MEIPPEIRYVEREGRSIAFQRFGSSMPFFVAAGIVALVGLLAFRLKAAMTERPAPAHG